MTLDDGSARRLAEKDPALENLRRRMQDYRLRDIHEIYTRIFQGSMPKLITTDVDRERFYTDYINTYPERDIKELSLVGKLGEFYDFLVFMAAYLCRWPNAETIENGAMDGAFSETYVVSEVIISVLHKLKMDIRPGVIICMADEILPYNRDVWYFPATGI